MSDFENEFVADEWAPYQEAYEQNPVETVAELANAYAQAAAAQYAPDPQAIAAQVLMQSEQLRANYEQQARDDDEAKLLDRSLAAKHGGTWAEHSNEVARRLATDENLQKKWVALDTQGRADLLDDVVTELDQKNRSKVFREIQAASSGKLGL